MRPTRGDRCCYILYSNAPRHSHAVHFEMDGGDSDDGYATAYEEDEPWLGD